MNGNQANITFYKRSECLQQQKTHGISMNKTRSRPIERKREMRDVNWTLFRWQLLRTIPITIYNRKNLLINQSDIQCYLKLIKLTKPKWMLPEKFPTANKNRNDAVTVVEVPFEKSEKKNIYLDDTKIPKLKCKPIFFCSFSHQLFEHVNLFSWYLTDKFQIMH